MSGELKKEMYTTLLEHAPLGIFKINMAGKFVWVNLPFAAILGFGSKEDCLQALNGIEDRSVHYVDPEQRNQILFSVKGKKDWQTHDVKFYNKYNNTIHVKLQIRFVSEPEEAKGYEGFVEEITDKKEILNALIQSESNFKNIFENLNDAIFVYDYEGKFLLVNNSACQLLGYTHEKLMSLNTQTISKNSYPSEEENVINSYGTEELAQSEQLLFGSALISCKGEIIPVEANTQFIEYQTKKAILTTARDVRERKYAEKTIMQAIMETESRERRRFSEDLHDGLGPLLSSMKIYTSMMLDDPDLKPEQYRILSKQKDIINQSIATTREVVNNLMPPVLQTHGFIAAIKTFTAGIARVHKLKINIDTGNFENQMDSNSKIIFYRIVNELINNTIKHAAAKNIDLFFGINNDIFTFTYRDDGCGMDFEQAFYTKKKGLGLKNIYNKMNSINGKVRISSAPGKGFSIKLEAPVVIGT